MNIATTHDLIQAASTLPMGSQVRLNRTEVGDEPEGVGGTLVTVVASPRMGFTSVFVLWDDREGVAEYRYGTNPMPLHHGPVTIERVDFSTEDPRMMDARVEVGQRLTVEAELQRAQVTAALA